MPLSCHGDEERRALIFEDEYGNADPITAVKLKQDGFGEHLPPLIFLSACHSAEETRKAKDGAEPAMPLSMSLVQAGFLAVLGWGGPVLDQDATRFAREFYSQVVRGRRLESAAAYARLAVLKQDDCPGRDWHLARLYLGPDGGVPLCTAGARPRPRKLLAEHGHQEILQTKQASESKAVRQLPVASRQSFVGRRRETQEILRVFRAGKEAGVLIHGQGRCGKTSLAARIANRLPALKPVVIFGDYRATAIFSEILKACPPALRPTLESQWLSLIEQRDANLGLALEAMLVGPLNQDSPILLIVDDLEQALDDPQRGQEPTTVKKEYLESLRGVVEAFAAALGQTESRLLFTSRYTFTLPDAKNHELATRLHALALLPMNEREQVKQMQARLLIGAKALGSDIQARCIEAAAANPGLQELLTSVALEDKAAAELALAAMECYLADGTLPQEQKTSAFLEDLALNTLLKAVDEDGNALLRAGTIFAIPVPEIVFAELAKALGIDNYSMHIRRLAGLGLLDRYIIDRENEENHCLVNRIVKPALLRDLPLDLPGHLIPGLDPGLITLSPADYQHFAKVALSALTPFWISKSNEVSCCFRAIEIMRLAYAA
ncbi:MAG: CHAT domain-containing protein, partial [Terriglobales bacterium]